MSDGPYSRIYWSIMDDPKFDGIRENARLFGSWALMLVVADMAHPVPAYVPPGVSRATIAALEAARLIEVLPAHRFRVCGLVSERARRSEAGRIGGLASGRSRAVERRLNGASNDLNLAKQSIEEKSKDETSTARAGASGAPRGGGMKNAAEVAGGFVSQFVRKSDAA